MAFWKLVLSSKLFYFFVEVKKLRTSLQHVTMKNTKLIIASKNKGKIDEIRMFIPGAFETEEAHQFDFDEFETTRTCQGNAAAKALACWRLTGLNCLADDSGLEVNALDGRPGVDSAFFAGHPRNDDRNISFLLDQMEGVVDRSASFLTVIALVLGGEVHLFEGRVLGTITNARRGSGGFGYDPVFIPEGEKRTFAEMSPEEKNSKSHRAFALAKLKAFLEKEIK